jgi:SAM-dependent methyltransferase
VRLSGVRFENRPCALCGASDPRIVARVDRYEVPLSVVRCGACGHVYLDPRPADADLPRLYDEEYYAGSDRAGAYTYVDDRRFSEAARLRARGRLLRLERFVPSGRLLEVGCSFGAFLVEARARGFAAEGVDLSPVACAACREAGITVREGTLEGAGFPAAAFDAVYMAETVEHLPDPRATVREAARVLREGGLLVLGTANRDSLARFLRGARWGYHMPGHLQYFSARSLGRLLREEGLRVLRRRFGDDRPLALLRAARRAAGLPAGPLGVLRDAVLRLHLGPFSLGAGMVLYASRRALSRT